MENPLSFTFFWRGLLSNWHKSTFDGLLWDEVQRRFCTTEQWMMSAKALLFSDLNALQAIMATNDPKEQKALGRQVSGFNKAKWDLHARNLVTRAVPTSLSRTRASKKSCWPPKGCLRRPVPTTRSGGSAWTKRTPAPEIQASGRDQLAGPGADACAQGPQGPAHPGRQTPPHPPRSQAWPSLRGPLSARLPRLRYHQRAAAGL